jgi:dynein heavy chain 2
VPFLKNQRLKLVCIISNFRSKSYKFEEFLSSWNEKISNSPNKSPITVRLLQEIEQYKNILPVLKYVRGEIFSDQHWNEMFGLLNMPRKGISELKFKDFLDVKHKLNDESQVRFVFENIA